MTRLSIMSQLSRSNFRFYSGSIPKQVHFVSSLVGNPEDGFSHDNVHLILLNGKI